LAKDKVAGSKDESPLDEHPIVGAIVGKDPLRVPDITSFIGYVGKSSSEDHIRLYSDLEFRNYLEIKRDDILHSEKLSDKVLEFGGTQLWIKADAEILHIEINQVKQQAKFLSGQITQRYVTPTAMRPIPRQYYRRVQPMRPNTQPRSCNDPGGSDCVGTCGDSCGGTCAWNTCAGTCGNTCPDTCPGTCGGSCFIGACTIGAC
jgi:hypothetical protein